MRFLECDWGEVRVAVVMIDDASPRLLVVLSLSPSLSFRAANEMEGQLWGKKWITHEVEKKARFRASCRRVTCHV